MQAHALADARATIFFCTFFIGRRGEPVIEFPETPGNSPAFQCRCFGGGGEYSAGIFFGEEGKTAGDLEELEFLGRERGAAQRKTLEGRKVDTFPRFDGKGRKEVEKEMKEALGVVDGWVEHAMEQIGRAHV